MQEEMFLKIMTLAVEEKTIGYNLRLQKPKGEIFPPTLLLSDVSMTLFQFYKEVCQSVF